MQYRPPTINVILFNIFTVKQCISMSFLRNVTFNQDGYCIFCYRQASVEKKRASAKDRLAKHREKIYSNPVLLEEYRRKERERSGDRVIIGRKYNLD